MTVRYEVGDTTDVIATIPDGSVSLVACSPPFIALRSYLPGDHPDKDKEIGSEPNPGAFLNRLLELTAGWGRVLAPWGSIAIELGDTYAGSGGAGGDYNPGGLRGGQGKADGSSARTRLRSADGDAGKPQTNGTGGPINRGGGLVPIHQGNGWPRPKCLALIPQAYALSLAYGINVLTGQPSPAGQWLVRNVVVWHRPNPAVGALGDKVRPSTSYITIATRSSKRWFDLDAVRSEPSANTHARLAKGQATAPRSGKSAERDGNFDTMPELATTAGAPPLDCWFDEHDTWTLTTQPSSLAHFAMWPAKLAERLILMMCPAEVCSVCGEPRRRVTGEPTYVNARSGVEVDKASWIAGGERLTQGGIGRDNGALRVADTVGWSDCGHGSYRCNPCNVLVPLADAVRRSSQSPRGEKEVGAQNLLGEPVQVAGEPASIPQDVRGVRGGLHGPFAGDAVLHEELLGEAGAPGGQGEHAGTHEGAGQSGMDGRTATPGGIRADLGPPGDAWQTEERLHDGTSSGDAEPHRPPARPDGDRPSSQRGEGRQQDHQPGDRQPRATRGKRGVPSLPEGVHDQLTCPGCGHPLEYVADHFVPGVVLDPFCGTGTSLCVAELHGRDSIGIDIDSRNRDLLDRRMDECRRALFGTKPQLDGQMDMFTEVPA